MTRTYKDWHIDLGYDNQWQATSPNYDASYEGEEDGWVDNGERVWADTLEALYLEIDNWIEENNSTL